MAFAQGKFGIEYNANPIDEESSGAGWLVVVIALAAIAVLAAAGVRRLVSSASDEPPPIDAPVAVQTTSVRIEDKPKSVGAPLRGDRSGHVGDVPLPPPPPPPPLPPGAERNRPRVAKNLLLKLEKAEAAHDVELAVSTIEQLRALPGEAVADLDNSLARRLGELNIRRLFVGRNRQWVKEVEVRRGDSATRIAFENGSTLASLLKLNSLPSADRLRVGQKLNVMDHPRFTIVVHRVAKYADLTLKGKFFKRYDIIAPVRAEAGNYETPAKLRAFLAEKGIALSPADSAELDMLVPAKSSLLVSDL
ncbi:MAG: LysM peptidoglycan-binding domain-containing protein [Kiritimatiellae bacterium]|nr:LysM peptidoglycan-binding domain-containing protein [Kiritimatiellia bacterium]